MDDTVARLLWTLTMDDTVARLLKGDQRALSRLISLLESGDTRTPEILAAVHSHTGLAYCVGVTGPPGVGKSSLVDRLTGLMRDERLSVGIIAVDPTSPYSGGSFLGDRIRMQRHYLDPGVFIRSMATRTGTGGLPRMVQGAVRLLDASGKDVVVVETAGVGQTELAIMGVADTVMVTLMPGAGDIIQALKAGIMEIADIYTVNKADLEGADHMIVAITSMIKMAASEDDWTPRVMATDALSGRGLPELYQEVRRHRDFLEDTARLGERREERRSREFFGAIEEELARRVKRLLARDAALGRVLTQVKNGEADPYAAAQSLLDGDLNRLAGEPAAGNDEG